MSLVSFIQNFSGKYISYYPHLNHISGSVLASLFLYELIFQDQYATDPDGIAITDETWKETLGFSRQEFESARNSLESQKLIVITKKGHPCRNYYRICKERIDQLWQSFQKTGESLLTRSRQKRMENLKRRDKTPQFARIEQTDIEVDTACPSRANYVVPVEQTGVVPVEQTSLSDSSKLSISIKKDLKTIDLKTIKNEGECGFQTLEADRSQCEIERPPDPIDSSIPVQSQIEDPSIGTKTEKIRGGRGEKNSKKKNPSTFSPEFMEFYLDYPRKENRPGASKTYEEFRASGVSHEEIMAALQKSKADWVKAGREKDKIPHPQTWLNREPWLDLDLPEPEIPELAACLEFYNGYVESCEFVQGDPGTIGETKTAWAAVLLDHPDAASRMQESAVYYFGYKLKDESKAMIHKAANFLRLGVWKQMLDLKDREEQQRSAIVPTDGSAVRPSLQDYRDQQRLAEMRRNLASVFNTGVSHD